MVSNLLTIDIQFIQTCYGNICPCRPYLLSCIKHFPEIGSRTVINIFVIANPSPLPVFHPHHARFETINIRRRFHSILIPYIHFPVIFGKGLKILSGIGNQNLFGVLFARIPDSSLPCNQFKRVFVYDDLTGCLPCSFSSIIQHP